MGRMTEESNRMENSLNKPKAQAYFSHSYRKDDREVNLYFWQIFYESGFCFAIDPKPANPDDNPLNVTYLERLMRSSDCFISVVPLRKKQDGPGYTHSVYLAFENFLAEMAEKPRLVFVEKGLDISVFGSDYSENVHVFERSKLPNRVEKIRAIVDDFSAAVRNYQNYSGTLQSEDKINKAGILIQANEQSGYGKEEIRLIQSQLMRTINYRSETPSASIEEGLQNFVRTVSGYRLLVLDVCDASISAEILAIIQARAIPCVRLAKSASNEFITNLRSKGLLKDYFVGSDSPLIVWDNINELEEKLEKYLNKFNQENERVLYQTYESGFRYFKNAGREWEAFIFIGNHFSLHTTATKLSNQLEGIGVGKDRYFQYAETKVKTGLEWKKEIDHYLTKCNIFVALINNEFLISDNCRYELQVAVKRQSEGVIIQAYLFEGDHVPESIRNIQYRDVRQLGEDDIVSVIARDLEEAMDRPAPKEEDLPKVAGDFNTPAFANDIPGTTVVNYTINQTITNSTIQGSVAAAGDMSNSLNTQKDKDNK